MEPLSRDSKITIAGIAIALVGGILMTYFHLSLFWTIIFVIIIIIGTIICLLLPRISNKIGVRSPFYRRAMVETSSQMMPPIQEPSVAPSSPATPVLTYGRNIVRKTRQPQHGGVYRRSSYFFEVDNNIPNTTARNCRGCITLLGSDIINRRTVWENNNRESINIGHREYLYLFKVEIFRTETGPESTRLYFTRPTDIDFVDEESRDTYDESLDRRLNVLIQSDNADFPSEADSFSKTIRQIIQDSVEERSNI